MFILTNLSNKVLYTGVTSDLKCRLMEHQNKSHPFCFTARYNVKKLVYYELFDSMTEAIKREKIIKGGSRRKKEELINRMNPGWNELEIVHG